MSPSGAQPRAWHSGDAHWQNMVFAVLIFARLVQVLVTGSERDALFTLGLRSNLTLLGSDHADGGAATRRCLPPGAAIGIQSLPLNGTELRLCFACASVVSTAVEAEKWLVRRGWLHAP